MPSAVIAAYQYDAVTETLTIRYHSNKVYNYLKVPERVFKEMRSTMVKGIWFNRHIKGNMPSKKLRRDDRSQNYLMIREDVILNNVFCKTKRLKCC